MVDIGVGCSFEQAEAQASAGAGFVEAHGHQHMARFGCAGVTRRSAGDGDALEVERDDEGLDRKSVV